MTESEALSELRSFPISCLDFKEQMALDMAIEAMKKQIPMKPIVQGLGQRYCPVCKCGGADHQYCARCGQKLG